AARNFVAKPWQVSVEGMVHRPRVFDVDDVMNVIRLEERIYRMRCVEGWSMVIPWIGIPLSKLIDLVEPMGSAKYVAFQTLLDPKRLPGQKNAVLEWPYVEGLRMDEAMHPLTMLAVGLYGRALPRKTAPRFGSSYPGNTVSKESSRLSRSPWSPTSRRRRGIARRLASTASLPM